MFIEPLAGDLDDHGVEIDVVGPVRIDHQGLDGELIRSTASGRERANTLALYLTLTEHAESADEQIEQRTGLGRDQIERAIEILIGAGLVREGTLVG